ncbi:MAG: hypothetical protein MJA31_03450 [Clostridia bacterium]|nr:hypothetical protein [Clostridia bacterium]
MNNEEKIFDLMTQMYSEIRGIKTDVSTLKTDVSTLKTDVSTLKTDVSTLKTEMKNVSNTVVKIENEQRVKFGALFDGYTQNSAKLDRIEMEVSRQEEIILRKIK